MRLSGGCRASPEALGELQDFATFARFGRVSESSWRTELPTSLQEETPYRQPDAPNLQHLP